MQVFIRVRNNLVYVISWILGAADQMFRNVGAWRWLQYIVESKLDAGMTRASGTDSIGTYNTRSWQQKDYYQKLSWVSLGWCHESWSLLRILHRGSSNLVRGKPLLGKEWKYTLDRLCPRIKRLGIAIVETIDPSKQNLLDQKIVMAQRSIGWLWAMRDSIDDILERGYWVNRRYWTWFHILV